MRLAYPLSFRARALLWSLLALPPLAAAIAMPLTDEVHWTASDFLFAALVLGGAGLGIEALMAVSRARRYRWAAAIGVAGLLGLTWVNAAVGIIGPTAEQLNPLYLLLPPLALAGAAACRMRPAGMALTMAGLVLTLVGIAAVLVTTQAAASGLAADDVARGVRLTGMFTLPLIASALLFALAAREARAPASRGRS